MRVYDTEVAGRRFLVLEDCGMIPVDRIKHVDLNPPNGGASGKSVRIVTDDPDDEWIFAFENAESVKAYFLGRRDEDSCQCAFPRVDRNSGTCDDCRKPVRIP